ncbi:MAG: hypothetical protein LQ337_001797 [Flavoplaca oasis]|nr:MAG: hypothetical protein LQ337_001797 [Flavoplaca oasis]
MPFNGSFMHKAGFYKDPAWWSCGPVPGMHDIAAVGVEGNGSAIEEGLLTIPIQGQSWQKVIHRYVWNFRLTPDEWPQDLPSPSGDNLNAGHYAHKKVSLAIGWSAGESSWLSDSKRKSLSAYLSEGRITRPTAYEVWNGAD